MNDFIYGIIPFISFFFLGMLFKHFKIFTKETGIMLLRMVFYLFMPAMVFSEVITQSSINIQMIILQLTPLIPIAVSFGLVTLFLKYFPQPKPIAGIIYCATMIKSTPFILPFVRVEYGLEAFNQAIFYDSANLFFIFTIIYVIAVKHGVNTNMPKRSLIKKVLTVPTLWAFVIGLILVSFDLTMYVPIKLKGFLDIAKEPYLPMVYLSLGLIFSPSKDKLPTAFLVVGMRMIVGFFIGLIITQFLPLEPIQKKIIIIGCTAPCGFTTMVFAALEKLDETFGATVCSISTFIGIFLLPLVIWFLG